MRIYKMSNLKLFQGVDGRVTSRHFPLGDIYLMRFMSTSPTIPDARDFGKPRCPSAAPPHLPRPHPSTVTTRHSSSPTSPPENGVQVAKKAMTWDAVTIWGVIPMNGYEPARCQPQVSPRYRDRDHPKIIRQLPYQPSITQSLYDVDISTMAMSFSVA